MPDVIRMVGQISAGVAASVAKAAAKRIKFLYLCYSTPLGYKKAIYVTIVQK